MSASGQHEHGLQMPIGAVEKETRVSKELLRMWERRYGFPLPDRDESGDRVYSRETVEKLKLIRLLIDRGYRPGRLMNMQRGPKVMAPRSYRPLCAIGHWPSPGRKPPTRGRRARRAAPGDSGARRGR